MFEVQCPQCGQQYRVGEEFRTRTAACRNCGGRIPIPPGDPLPAAENTPEPDPLQEYEQTPGGSTVFRHEAHRQEFVPAIGDSENIERIEAHIARHLGPPDSVFHEVISHLVHIDVHVIEPRPDRNFWTLVTSGMSDRVMTPPDHLRDTTHYAELMLCLPPDWPVGREEFERDEYFWPMRWLKMLARFPHEYETWLDLWHTVPNGDPPEPFAPGTDLCCWLFAPPQNAPDEFFELQIHEEKTIRFLAIVALHRSELELKLDQGTETLLERFDTAGVNELLRADRDSVV